MSDSGYTPSTITDYVLTVLNDQKYGYDIEWVRLNLRRSHLEQKEAARDAVIREDERKLQAERDAVIAEEYRQGDDWDGWVCREVPEFVANAIRGQSFTRMEGE